MGSCQTGLSLFHRLQHSERLLVFRPIQGRRMSQSPNTDPSARYSVSGFVGAVADARTYRNVLYHLLAFPLGTAYYIILVVGFTWDWGSLFSSSGWGFCWGQLLGSVLSHRLGTGLRTNCFSLRFPIPTPSRRTAMGSSASAKVSLQAPSTWRGHGFVVLEFWIGILSFLLRVSFVETGIELLMLPLVPPGVLDVQVVGWEVAKGFQTASQRAAAVSAGVVLAFGALHVLNLFASANAPIASSLLGPGGSDSSDRTGPEPSI